MASTIKNEVRILGMDSCNRFSTLGAVVRGGLYLDGVLKFGKSQTTNQVARHVRESRYFPELRFIMAHQRYPNGREMFETEKIEKTTGLPVVEITRSRPGRRGEKYTRIIHVGKSVYVRSRLDPAKMKRLLELSWTHGIFPEPVRIAHLLAKVNISESSPDDKG